jgi:glutaredoxin
MAKSFLEANKIPYQDVDVAKDKAARDEMVRKSGALSVPVIEIDGELLIGFDEKKLKEKIGI